MDTCELACLCYADLFLIFRWGIALLNLFGLVISIFNFVSVWKMYRKPLLAVYRLAPFHLFFVLGAFVRFLHFSISPYSLNDAMDGWFWSLPFNFTFVGYCLMVLNLAAMAFQQSKLSARATKPNRFKRFLGLQKRVVPFGHQPVRKRLKLDFQALAAKFLLSSLGFLFIPDLLLRILQTTLHWKRSFSQHVWLVFFGSLVVVLNLVLHWSVSSISELLLNRGGIVKKDSIPQHQLNQNTGIKETQLHKTSFLSIPIFQKKVSNIAINENNSDIQACVIPVRDHSCSTLEETESANVRANCLTNLKKYSSLSSESKNSSQQVSSSPNPKLNNLGKKAEKYSMDGPQDTKRNEGVMRLKLISICTHILSTVFISSIIVGLLFNLLCESYSSWIAFDSFLIISQSFAIIIMSSLMKFVAKSSSQNQQTKVGSSVSSQLN